LRGAPGVFFAVETFPLADGKHAADAGVRAAVVAAALAPPGPAFLAAGVLAGTTAARLGPGAWGRGGGAADADGGLAAALLYGLNTIPTTSTQISNLSFARAK